MARSNDRGLFERPTGSGVWWILYYDANGVRHRQKVGSKTEARKRYVQRKDEIRAEKFDPESLKRRRAMSVQEMVTKYRAVRRENPDLLNQGEDERYARYWVGILGDLRADAVTAEQLDEWRRGRLKEGRKPATINRPLTYLKAYYNLAIKDGAVKVLNPVSRLKTLRENNGRLRYLNEDEEDRVLAVLPEGLYRDLVRFAIQTGLRRDEQFSMRWEHVDFRSSVLHVPRTKSGGSREVHLNPEVVAILEGQREAAGGSDWVWPASRATGGRDVHMVGKNFVRRVYAEAVKAAGLKDVTWHTLRHTFGSRLAQAGVPLRTIQVLMGHKSMRMTERYSHLAPDNMKSAVAMIQRRPVAAQPPG